MTCCRFINVRLGTTSGTVLLENAAGDELFKSTADLQRAVSAIFDSQKRLSLSESKREDVVWNGLDGLHGKTLYLV